MHIPDFIQDIISKLKKAGHEAYIVGGCVRDLLMDKEPKISKAITKLEEICHNYGKLTIFDRKEDRIRIRIENFDCKFSNIINLQKHIDFLICGEDSFMHPVLTNNGVFDVTFNKIQDNSDKLI